jgi:hypothetical protein
MNFETEKTVKTALKTCVLTLGIGSWIWLAKANETLAKETHNKKLTSAIILIPFIGWIIWLWKFCDLVEIATVGKTSKQLNFIAIYLLWWTGVPQWQLAQKLGSVKLSDEMSSADKLV